MNKRRRIENLGEKVKKGKKFVRYDEGAELYSMGLHAFMSLAKEAGAIYKLRKTVLVNTEIINEYLELFKQED